MTRETVAALLHDNRIPQNALVRVAGVSGSRLSLFLSGQIDLPESAREEISYGLTAMLEALDDNPLIDWRQIAKIKPQLDEKVAGYRRARVADLRHSYDAAGQVAIA